MKSKRLHVVGGLYGAGKTILANTYLAKGTWLYFGVDKIATELCPEYSESVAVAAGHEVVWGSGTSGLAELADKLCGEWNGNFFARSEPAFAFRQQVISNGRMSSARFCSQYLVVRLRQPLRDNRGVFCF